MRICSGKFEAGKRYWAQLTVVMPSNAKQEFTSSTNGYINNDNSTKKTWNAEDKTITLSLPFEVPTTLIPVDVVSDRRTKGKELPTSITVPKKDEDKYTFSETAWNASWRTARSRIRPPTP